MNLCAKYDIKHERVFVTGSGWTRKKLLFISVLFSNTTISLLTDSIQRFLNSN